LEDLQISSDKNQIQTPEKWKEDNGTEDGYIVSEKVYWENYYSHPDFNYEWNEGVLEEKPMSDYAGYLMYLWFIEILRHFFTVYPIGKMIGLEIGFRLALPDKVTIRKPDLGVILNHNPIQIYMKDETYQGIFDLCVESLSHSSLREIKRDTVIKKKEYELIGVKEYYILDARGKETAFYSLGKSGKYKEIKEKNGIIRSEALPGFQFRISDLYNQPSLKELADDNLYSNFILPFYRIEKQILEQEKLNLVQEKQILELKNRKSEEKAEKLAAKLIELGISPESV